MVRERDVPQTTQGCSKLFPAPHASRWAETIMLSGGTMDDVEISQ